MSYVPPTPGRYQAVLKCYPPIYTDLSERKQRELSQGGKILMPPSELQRLMSDPSVSYPMMFRARKDSRLLTTQSHCGVLEFTAPDNMVIFPQWMMDNLGVSDGEGTT